MMLALDKQNPVSHGMQASSSPLFHVLLPQMAPTVLTDTGSSISARGNVCSHNFGGSPKIRFFVSFCPCEFRSLVPQVVQILLDYSKTSTFHKKTRGFKSLHWVAFLNIMRTLDFRIHLNNLIKKGLHGSAFSFSIYQVKKTGIRGLNTASHSIWTRVSFT